jgi:hypothetical protein
LYKTALTGRIRIKADLGEDIRYNREDVERLRAEPARPNAAQFP